MAPLAKSEAWLTQLGQEDAIKEELHIMLEQFVSAYPKEVTCHCGTFHALIHKAGNQEELLISRPNTGSTFLRIWVSGPVTFECPFCTTHIEA